MDQKIFWSYLVILTKKAETGEEYNARKWWDKEDKGGRLANSCIILKGVFSRERKRENLRK